MSRTQKLAYGLAAVGVGIALSIFTYLEITNYTPFRPIMIAGTLILCPASVLAAGFLDIEPHSVEAVLGWLLIAAINGTLYGIIGYAVGKYVWKSS